jgi:putative phosphoribosyl transferase
MFKDRQEAGRVLAGALSAHARSDALVLALPRGGVPVAAEICTELKLPLGIIIVRKISSSRQPELALGAVGDDSPPVVVRNDLVLSQEGISDNEFQKLCDKQVALARSKRLLYLGHRRPLDLTGRTAILVDDGIATGATMRVAVGVAHARGAKIVVVAVPVGATDALDALRKDVSEVVCVEPHKAFGAVGQYYKKFGQVSDDEVVDLMERVGSSRAPHSV